MIIRFFCISAVITLGFCGGCATGEFLTKSKKDAPTASMLDQQLSMARLMERNGNGSQAVHMYRRILESDARNGTAHHRLGILAAKNQQIDEALNYFAAAEEALGQNADLLNDVGYLYFLTGDLETAEQKFTQALAADPHHLSARNNLGTVYGHQKKWQESFREFRIANNDAEAYSNLAFVQAQTGELTAAKANFHKALDLDPNLRPAAEALLQLPREISEESPQFATNQSARQTADAAAGAVGPPTQQGTPAETVRSPMVARSNMPTNGVEMEPSESNRPTAVKPVARQNVSNPINDAVHQQASPIKTAVNYEVSPANKAGRKSPSSIKTAVRREPSTIKPVAHHEPPTTQPAMHSEIQRAFEMAAQPVLSNQKRPGSASPRQPGSANGRQPGSANGRQPGSAPPVQPRPAGNWQTISDSK